jgi:probable phosphoglycerate mutase
MLITEVLANLIASAIGAVAIYIVGKLLTDFYYIDFSLTPQEEDKEKEKCSPSKKKSKHRFKLKIIRKLPWRYAYKYAQKACDDMFKDSNMPTFIVGIGRGGATYGSMLSYLMGEKPIIALDRLYGKNEQDQRQVKRFPVDIPAPWLKNVLLVAGEYHSGDTMLEFKEWLESIGAEKIHTCVLYFQTGYPGQTGRPDYFGIAKKYDCLLPWQEINYLRTWKNPKEAEKRELGLKELIPERFEACFFLMRHAHTAANAEDKFIGSGSPQENISYEGIMEARNVGNFLKDMVGQIDVIYCSPMARCVQTATEIQSVTGGKIIRDERLVEVDFGNWEGVKRSDIPEEEYEKYVHDQHYNIPGSHDSYQGNQTRAKDFLDYLTQHQVSQGKRILVVTHKTIGRIMVQLIENKENQHFRSIPMENASLRKVVVQDGKMSVSYYIKALEE